MRRITLVLALATAASLFAQPTTTSDPVPQSVDEFRSAAERILRETGVPGAGLALVRSDGVEWAGGVGFADRDNKIPVTEHTAFRVGSISKTFVAMALVQLSEDGFLDLDSLVHETVPDVEIDNAWDETDPVRVIHLLQHTAGFDDMHFNETYVRGDEPELPLDEVLKLNPNSRRVRWRPGTRMSYANPGYAIAGLILEKTAGMPYEDYIAQEIFAPLGMQASSFRLTDADEPHLAQGYASDEGPPVGYPRIYLRPAGNMHSTPHDMARFIQMLLNWGELGDAFVIDPEYLGNMEYPRTTLASQAGLRNGYGSGIAALLNLPFPLLGHGGGITGFLSQYAYSPARDAGFVILLNSTGPGAGGAMRRLSTMALSYLKRDVEPPAKPEIALDEATLDRYVGYYHDASPRNQFMWALQSLFAGRTILREGSNLYTDPVFGDRVRLIPVTASMFRLDEEMDASHVFTADAEGTMVLTGSQLYAERIPRWRVEIRRWPALAIAPLLATVFPVAVVWLFRIRRAQPRGYWPLKLAVLLCPLVAAAPAVALAATPRSDWGVRSPGSVTFFIATLAIPALAVAVGLFTLNAARNGASWLLTTYTGLLALALAGMSLYLSSHGLLGARLWAY